MRKPKIEVKLTQEKYVISIGDTKINVEAQWQGRLWIHPVTKFGGNPFVFQNSRPEVVRDIGLLLIEASKLAKKNDEIAKKGKK